MMESTTERVTESIKEEVRDAVSSFLVDLWKDVAVALASTSYCLALVGGSIFIILYVAGWERGLRWTGILFVAHVLLRAILAGGGVQ
jgi:hypothetical protein